MIKKLKAKSRINSHNKKRWLFKYRFYLLLLLIISLLWSWLFLIDVARLSSSRVTGYITVFSVFLILVGLSTYIFLIAINWLKRDIKVKTTWLTILKIACIWALAEAVIAWLVALIFMGKNGSIDNILPFSSLTPLAMWTPLGYLVRFVGFWGLSGLIVAGIACLWVKSLRKYSVACWGIIIVLTLLSWVLYRSPNGQDLTVITVSERLGEPRLIKPENSQLIVLPEYGLDEFNTAKINKRIEKTTEPVYFVGSQQKSSDRGYTNLLVFGDNQKGFVETQQKSRLIPGGEYIAYAAEVLLRVFDESTYTDFQVRRAVIKGNKAAEPYRINESLIIGSEVCSSIIQPSDYRRLTNEGATILTNSASLEIFNGSRMFNWQHRGLAKFMAVANARPMVQASHNWPAFVLNSNGRQLAEVYPANKAQVMVKTNKQKTLYTLVGEWLVYLGAFFVILDLVQRRRKKQNKKNTTI